jgi:transposase-like protein
MEESVVCPICGATQSSDESLLGALGTRQHFRCRDCGMEFSHAAAAELRVSGRQNVTVVPVGEEEDDSNG